VHVEQALGTFHRGSDQRRGDGRRVRSEDRWRETGKLGEDSLFDADLFAHRFDHKISAINRFPHGAGGCEPRKSGSRFGGIEPAALTEIREDFTFGPVHSAGQRGIDRVP
jgi:hypothetical protein